MSVRPLTVRRDWAFRRPSKPSGPYRSTFLRRCGWQADCERASRS